MAQESEDTMAQDSEDTTQTSIAQVDEALGKYYKALKKQQQYTEEDGRGTQASPCVYKHHIPQIFLKQKGKFQFYCDENGIEEDALHDEMNVDPADSVFDEIDDEFPIPQNEEIATKEQKQQYIFRIVKHCYDNPNTTWSHIITGLPAFNKQLFQSIEEKEIEITKKTYLNQCPAIYYQGLNIDISLLQSYVQKQIPL